MPEWGVNFMVLEEEQETLRILKYHQSQAHIELGRKAMEWLAVNRSSTGIEFVGPVIQKNPEGLSGVITYRWTLTIKDVDTH